MEMTFLDLVRSAADGLDGVDPDGMAVRRALLLAAHAGLARSDTFDADWDFYTVAVDEALHELTADLGDPLVYVAGLPKRVPQTDELRDAVAVLVRRLAGLFAEAAGGEAGSPWRRLVWAQVAHRLDGAVAELA